MRPASIHAGTRTKLLAAAAAIDPAPFRGVSPLPLSSLRSARPVLGNPASRSRAVALTYEQFQSAERQVTSRPTPECGAVATCPPPTELCLAFLGGRRPC